MDSPILIPEYNAWFQKYIFKQNVYHSMIKSAKIYNNPVYTLKDFQKFFPTLSYRVINDWDRKKLIGGTRKNLDAGWRKFSIMDIIKFFIITDLRKYGMPIPKIKNVLQDLSCNFIFLKDEKSGLPEQTKYLHFEYFLILCTVGEKILLLIDEQQNTLLHDEYNMFHLLGSKYFYAPCMLLPFYEYVKKFFKWVSFDIKTRKDTTLYGLLEIVYNLKIQTILGLIANDKYKKIEIKRKSNDHLLITAKSVRSGKFNKKDILDSIDQKDYLSVKTTKEDGQIVTITLEERFWI